MAVESQRGPVTIAIAAPAASTLRRLAPVLFALLLVAPSGLWDALDHSVWPWDPAWYGQVSVDLWSTLRLHPHQWTTAMTHAFGLKPPAIAWLGEFFVPLGGVLGGDATALLFSNLLWQILTLIAVYVAVRHLVGSLAAVFAALVLASAPLFISASHEYFAEPVQTLSIAWAILILAFARTWRPALVVAQLPGVIAFGLLTKLSTPPYMAGPLLGAVAIAFLSRRNAHAASAPWRDPQVLGLAALSILLTVGTIEWYRFNLHQAIQHYRDASANNGLYGTARGYPRQFLGWLENLRNGSFLPHFGLAVLVLVVLALATSVVRRNRPALVDTRLIAAVSCAFSLLLVVALFASQPNQEPRYLLPLVPLLAVLLSLVLAWPGIRVLLGAAIVIVAAECALTNLRSFGYLVHTFSTVALASPQRSAAGVDALDSIVDRTCTPAAAYKISMVGADYPWFNFNTLQMIAAERFELRGRVCYYTSLGYAEADPDVAWQRVQQFQPPYFIGIDYGNPTNVLPAADRATIRPGDPFNRINRIVFRRALRSGSFTVVRGSRSGGFVILRAHSSSG